MTDQESDAARGDRVTGKPAACAGRLGVLRVAAGPGRKSLAKGLGVNGKSGLAREHDRADRRQLRAGLACVSPIGRRNRAGEGVPRPGDARARPLDLRALRADHDAGARLGRLEEHHMDLREAEGA